MVNAQQNQLLTPLESSGYKSLTSYDELTSFVHKLDSASAHINLFFMTTSSEGRAIPALEVCSKEQNSAKLTVMVFCQQHGNEASGKEAALLLLRDFANGKLNGLLKHLNFLVIPQVNPDGAERDARRNGTNIDLNRNHLILTAPETKALHQIYDTYQPHVTLDVHEYYPWDDTTSSVKLIKTIDEQFGIMTNLNTGEELRAYSKKNVLPFLQKSLASQGYSFAEYTVGSFAEGKRVRYSTVDIDDGRQSFGIQGTLSFIAEGLNGQHSSGHSIERRAKAQYALMIALFDKLNRDHAKIGKMVIKERKRLVAARDPLCIRMEHVPNGKVLTLSLFDVVTGQDSVFHITNFHPKVKALERVKPPKGYLVPKTDTLLIRFLKNHRIKTEALPKQEDMELIVYNVVDLHKDTLEGMPVQAPLLVRSNSNLGVQITDYIYVPINQSKSALLVTAFEPRSMLGLVNYDAFAYLLQAHSPYPILRLE